MTGYSDHEKSDSFDPYPESIYIYDNKFTGGGDSPDQFDLKLLKTAMFGLSGSLPDILWDGYVDKNKMVDNQLPEHLNICINNGDSEMVYVDAPNQFSDPRLVAKEHQCDLPKIAKVTLLQALGQH